MSLHLTTNELEAILANLASQNSDLTRKLQAELIRIRRSLDSDLSLEIVEDLIIKPGPHSYEIYINRRWTRDDVLILASIRGIETVKLDASSAYKAEITVSMCFEHSTEIIKTLIRKTILCG